MAAPGAAPIQVPLEAGSGGTGTDELLTALLRLNPSGSDLIFSPGRKLQIQVNGKFVPFAMPGSPTLTADDTRRIASGLIGENKAALAMLREQGYCDISYAVAGLARFRVNIFIQRGSCAVVMRVIPTQIPTFEALGLPESLRGIAELRDGLVLVAGPRASGKTSTLAALIDVINENQTCHIITIEDPIEYLHNHKQATVHQRELHSDTPSVIHAMRAALRQAPNVIAVGELKNRDAAELALEAAETGHLVLSTLNTLNARRMVERFLGFFPANEHTAVRERLARMLRFVISQRLIPRREEGTRVPVFEVLKAGSRPLDRLLETRPSDPEGRPALLESGIDLEIAKLVRAGIVSLDIAAAYATDPKSLPNKIGAQASPETIASKATCAAKQRG